MVSASASQLFDCPDFQESENHPTLGVVDVYAATIPTLAFRPACT